MKRWWKSKTLWANAIAIACAFVSHQYGIDIPAEGSLVGMGGLNMILRAITKEGLS